MSDIRIEVYRGDYSNDDVYQNVLGYLANKAYLGGYGFSPNLPMTITEQFQLSEQYSQIKQDQKIWHFGITFSYRWKHTDLLKLADDVSLFFSQSFQIMYALDLKRDTGENVPHLHFAVNAFSYHPDFPPLSREYMKVCMPKVQNYLCNKFDPLSVTLQFQGKGKQDV